VKSSLPLAQCRRVLVHFAGDRNAGLAEGVGDLRFAEAGGVVFEGELVFLLVDTEAAEAVGVGEFAEAAELVEAQRRLQFVGNLEERHEASIAGGRKSWQEVGQGKEKRVKGCNSPIERARVRRGKRAAGGGEGLTYIGGGGIYIPGEGIRMAGENGVRKAAGVDSELKEANRKRLRRIEGQVRGLQRMVEEDRYCADIIVQIASVQEALRGVARNLMKNHLHHCAAKAIRSGKPKEAEAMYDELLELIYAHLR